MDNEKDKDGSLDLFADITEIENELKDRYRKDSTPNPPWLDESTEPEFLVDLVLEEYSVIGETERKAINYEDLFKPIGKKPKSPRSILVSGGTGYGKTTLLTKLKNDWVAERNNQLSEYKLLVFYQLRDLPKGSNLDVELKNIIGSFCKDGQKDRDGFTESLVKSTQNRLLLLLDGFDEVNENTQKAVACILREKSVFSKSTVVVSSRVEHKKGFVEFFERRVLVVGCSDIGRDELLKHVFHEQQTKLRDVETYLANPLVPEVFGLSPLTLLLLCYIFHDDAVPACELYTSSYDVIIEFMKQLIRRCFLSDDPREKIESVMFKMGSFFISKLEQNKCVFALDELERAFLDDWKVILCSGIIRTSTKKDMFEPSHKAFMDTLAARYANCELNQCSIFNSKNMIQKILGNPDGAQIFIVCDSRSESYLVFRGWIDVLFYCIKEKTFVTEGQFMTEADFSILVESSEYCFQVNTTSDELTVIWMNWSTDKNSKESSIHLIIDAFDSIISKIIDTSSDILDEKPKGRKDSQGVCLHRKLSKHETLMLNIEYGKSGFRELFGEEPFRTCNDLTKSLFYPVLREDLEVDRENGDMIRCFLNLRVLQDSDVAFTKCRYQLVEL